MGKEKGGAFQSRGRAWLEWWDLPGGGPGWRGGAQLVEQTLASGAGRGLDGGEGPGWRAGPGWREVPVRSSGPVLQEMASSLPTAAASAVDLCPLLTWGLLTT